MTFTRTVPGLAATPLFQPGYEVLLVVEGADGSGDVLFWRNVFNKFQPGITVNIKRGGGKNDILKILDTKRFNQHHTILCVDRDHDDLNDHVVQHTRLIRTYGYSIENDVLIASDSIKNLLEILTGESFSQELSSEILHTSLQATDLELNNPCLAIRLAFRNGLIIDGERVHNYLNYDNGRAYYNEKKFFEYLEKVVVSSGLSFQFYNECFCESRKSFRGHTLINLFFHRLSEAIEKQGARVNLDQKMCFRLMLSNANFDVVGMRDYYDSEISLAVN